MTLQAPTVLNRNSGQKHVSLVCACSSALSSAKTLTFGTDHTVASSKHPHCRRSAPAPPPHTARADIVRNWGIRHDQGSLKARGGGGRSVESYKGPANGPSIQKRDRAPHYWITHYIPWAWKVTVFLTRASPCKPCSKLQRWCQLEGGSLCQQDEGEWTNLRLWEVEVESLAQGGHSPGSCLEAGAATVLHHLYQQDDPVSVLTARQEPLDAQHLQSTTFLRALQVMKTQELEV